MRIQSFFTDPIIHRSFKGTNDPITSCIFSPDMKQCITGSTDGNVFVWNFKPQMRPFKFIGHKSGINEVAINIKGDLIASASNDESVRLWSNSVNGKNQLLKCHASPVRSVDFSTNNKFLLTASNDKVIKIFNITSPKIKFISSYTGHNNWIRCARFSPDDRLIGSSGDDNTIKIFDIEKKNMIHCFNDHLSHVNSCRFSPDGTLISSCSDDKTIKIFDIRSGRLIQHYDAHTDKVNCISYHASGNYLISCSDDSTVKIWDLKMGQILYTVHGHQGKIKSVNFSKEGDYFCSGGEDSILMVWKSNIKNMDDEYKILSDYLNNQDTLKTSTGSKKSTIRDKKNLTVKMKDKDNKNDIDKNIINNTNDNNKESNLTNFEFTTSSIDRMVMQLTNFSKTMNEMGQRIDNVEYQIEDIYKRRNMGNIHPNDNKIDSENVIKEVISEENGKINNPVEIFEDIKEHVEDIKQTE